jgi:hypothetical protein
MILRIFSGEGMVCFLNHKAITSISLLLLGACASQSPFPEGRYSFDQDPLACVYRSELQDISASSFDSEQVSNKHLDPEMIAALEIVNERLAHPELLKPEHRYIFNQSGLSKITIASASRSAWHQSKLSSSYKAGDLGSMHLLGLAVDLEMNDKPFDVKRRGHEPQVRSCYLALSELLISCGLVFSESVKKDPNHIELLKYCRKIAHPSFDEKGWLAKNEQMLKKYEMWSRNRGALEGARDARSWTRFGEKVTQERLGLRSF